MTRLIVLIAFCTINLLQAQKTFTGFFDFSYEESLGKITLDVPQSMIDEEFIYVNSLSAGIGSNDIGLDRGQIGKNRIVKFIKAGNKIMLMEPNYRYRALTDNELERKATEEAFASSVLFGFEIVNTTGNIHKIDLTPFVLRDAHGVANRLKQSNQGTYKMDKSRSAIWLDRTKSFPDNSEFEGLITFTGDGTGDWIQSVTPDAESVTVRVHHSFVRLPDDNFEARTFHPYSGFGMVSYYDYATSIDEPIVKRFIRKHRLKKKNPGATVSEAVEPIVYYIDPGCPEPVKSALMEGIAWWDQAFQAAGYAPNTFQIKELPAGADMLDVRYNVIQWIHRSTRGWSYGMSVVDPRTGEIIKGHVSLGSLRVRQDLLIAQGIFSPYDGSENPNEKMKEMALARLRQLGAHEVGHTLGLAHNFASSVNNRASVMDYPHPVFALSEGGIGIEEVYDDKIGNWDKKTISYGYSDFPEGTNVDEELRKMVTESQEQGYLYISDRDSRPIGGAHALSHLWDNGSSPVTEMERLMALRKDALSRFGSSSIPDQTPLSELEKVLVPVYLMHRYQAESVVKMIGGLFYHYNLKGDAYADEIKLIEPDKQGEAVDILLRSLTPEHLSIPKPVLKLVHPPAMGYSRDRETFKGRTSLVFDPLSGAESYANDVISMMLHKDRLARIYRQNVSLGSPIELDGYLSMMASEIFDMLGNTPEDRALIEMVQKIFMMHLLQTSFDPKTDPQVAGIAYGVLKEIETAYLNDPKLKRDALYHARYLKRLIESVEDDIMEIQLPSLKSMPPGSPIGCGDFH